MHTNRVAALTQTAAAHASQRLSSSVTMLPHQLNQMQTFVQTQPSQTVLQTQPQLTTSQQLGFSSMSAASAASAARLAAAPGCAASACSSGCSCSAAWWHSRPLSATCGLQLHAQ